MDLRSLRYFCAAAEAGSLTAAAERCHVAQPSISNAVANWSRSLPCACSVAARRASL
ncbi:LysR family transcriptional regulator [Halopseudomonas pachastrellae]|nr:LysR family transcriptional regulator [Halopseudomonas pachastrellae]